MAIQINKEKNEICILLNKDFYNIEEIKSTLKDFKEVCKGEVKEKKENQIKIILKPNENSVINSLGHEFCNYSLGLMKNHSVV